MPDISFLLHDLVCLVLTDGGGVIATDPGLVGDRRPVVEASSLPEGAFELHYFASVPEAEAFRTGLSLLGSNLVSSAPSEGSTGKSVLVCRHGEERPAAVDLHEAVPLVTHADPTPTVTSVRWKSIFGRIEQVAPSSASIRPIHIQYQAPHRLDLRVRFDVWSRRLGEEDQPSPNLYVTLFGRSDSYTCAVSLDRPQTSHLAAERAAFVGKLDQVAAKAGGSLKGNSIVFEQPDDLMGRLRGLRDLALGLQDLNEEARIYGLRRMLSVDKNARRVLMGLKDGAYLDCGKKCYFVDGDQKRLVTQDLFRKLFDAGLIEAWRSNRSWYGLVRNATELAGLKL